MTFLIQIDGKQNPKIQSVFVERFPIFTAHFSPDGYEVIMGSKHKNFYYYDMISGKVINVPHIKGEGKLYTLSIRICTLSIRDNVF